MSSKIKVVARLRPKLPNEPADDGIRVCHADDPADTSANANASTGSTSSNNGPFTGVAVNNPRDPSQIFRFPFTSAYDASASQEEIFEENVRPLIDVALSGITVTIFAYGVTSSGKTFTMQGSAAQPGVIPRVVEALFDKPPSASRKTDVKVSYMEIYKDEVYDLLVARESAPKLHVREDGSGMVFVAGLVSTPISSAREFDTLYSTATSRRSVGATRLNDQSSRSHAVLTLNISTREGSVVREGKINLVDLAGSENNKQTGNDQSRMAESKAINTSLQTLGMVVHALNKGDTRIPYRNSKLTRLLQDALGGSSVGLLICNLAPSAKFRQDTLNTLNFAVRTKNIENRPVVNERETRAPPAPPRVDLAQLQQQSHTRRNSVQIGQGRPSLVPRPASRTSSAAFAGIPVASNRMSMAGVGLVSGASKEAEKEKAGSGLSEKELDELIAKRVEAEVAKRLEEKEKERLEREKEEQEKLAVAASSSRSPRKKAKSSSVERDDDDLQARLRELERKFESANNKPMVDHLSPVSKKKTGKAFVALARTHQDRGELETALDLYRRAETYVPGNQKLRERIIEIEWAVKKGKAYKASPKRKKAEKDKAEKPRSKSSSSKSHHHKTKSRSKSVESEGEMEVVEVQQLAQVPDEDEDDDDSENDQMEVDEVESSLTGRAAFAGGFGVEVTNSSSSSSGAASKGKGKSKRTLADAEEMEITPAKRAKTAVLEDVVQRGESDEENVNAPRKIGKGRSYRRAQEA